MPAARLNHHTAARYAERFQRLCPHSAPRWGRMSATQMLAHLRRTVEISLDGIEGSDRSNLFTRTVGRWTAFHLMPRWPGGVLPAPAEYTAEPEGDVESERRALLEAVRRFTEAAERRPDHTALSPLFGPMPLRYWQRVHARHFEHHLRQFNL